MRMTSLRWPRSWPAADCERSRPYPIGGRRIATSDHWEVNHATEYLSPRLRQTARRRCGSPALQPAWKVPAAAQSLRNDLKDLSGELYFDDAVLASGGRRLRTRRAQEADRRAPARRRAGHRQALAVRQPPGTQGRDARPGAFVFRPDPGRGRRGHRLQQPERRPHRQIRHRRDRRDRPRLQVAPRAHGRERPEADRAGDRRHVPVGRRNDQHRRIRRNHLQPRSSGRPRAGARGRDRRRPDRQPAPTSATAISSTPCSGVWANAASSRRS